MPGCDGRRILSALTRTTRKTIVFSYRLLACHNCAGRSAVARIRSNQPSFLLTPTRCLSFTFRPGSSGANSAPVFLLAGNAGPAGRTGRRTSARITIATDAQRGNSRVLCRNCRSFVISHLVLSIIPSSSLSTLHPSAPRVPPGEILRGIYVKCRLAPLLQSTLQCGAAAAARLEDCTGLPPAHTGPAYSRQPGAGKTVRIGAY